MTGAGTGRAAARALGADEEAARGAIEPWSWVAFALFALAGAAVVYLGVRPGGGAPIWVWGHGRFWLVGAALLVLLIGAAWSVLHRPFLQRRRARAFLALVVLIGVLPFPMPYPSSFEHSPSGVAFRLPVNGEWTVHQSGGGGGPLAAFTADRRWGLHLAKAADLARSAPPGSPSEWSAYDEPVVAPAAGTVAWVRDGLPDHPPESTLTGPDPELGNVIVLEVEGGHHVFLGHLRAGSLLVSPGAVVEPGQPVARLGCSGSFRFTPVPHLSLHLQAGAREGRGEAVPWTFRGYEANGAEVERGLPSEGDVVRN